MAKLNGTNNYLSNTGVDPYLGKNLDLEVCEMSWCGYEMSWCGYEIPWFVIRCHKSGHEMPLNVIKGQPQFLGGYL